MPLKQADRHTRAIFAGNLFFILVCAVLATCCALWGALNSFSIDWSMLAITGVCLFPALLIVDCLALCVTGWGGVRWKDSGCLTESGLKETEGILVRLACLAGLHLFVAGLAAFLLATPANSVWMQGISLLRLRTVLLALEVLSVFLALEVPYIFIRIFLRLLRA